MLLRPSLSFRPYSGSIPAAVRLPSEAIIQRFCRPEDVFVCSRHNREPRHPIDLPGIARMVVDKVVLKVPGILINPEVVKQLCKRAPVHFLKFNDQDFKLVIHMDWLPEVEHIGIRVFWAIVEMLKLGAFEARFSALVKILSLVWNQDNRLNSFRVRRFLAFYFQLNEWELAMDFFGAPLVQYFHPLDFIRECNTHYTERSYKKIHRNVNGTKESKGVQRSPLKVYLWHLKHGGDDYCDRMEFRYEKKFNRFLTWELLEGTVAEAYFLLLPSMVEIMNHETAPSRFEFYGYWLLGAPWWFRELLEASGWLPSSAKTLKDRGTRKQKKEKLGGY